MSDAWVMPPTFRKDESETLDYVFDFASKTNGTGEKDWLSPGDSIDSFTVEVDDGITLEDSSLIRDNTAVVVWISGGVLYERYNITVEAVTNAGRRPKRTIVIRMVDR